MHTKHSELRIARKRSPLTQTDIGFILNLSDYGYVNKWESGKYRPSLDSLLSYHLIFDLPIESFFEQQKKAVAQAIGMRIQLRLSELKAQKPDQRQMQRIAFLESILAKLSSVASL